MRNHGYAKLGIARALWAGMSKQLAALNRHFAKVARLSAKFDAAPVGSAKRFRLGMQIAALTGLV